jgi:hypothetical protein
LYFFNTVCPHLNYFWHQEDNFTLTSQGYIWTYPDKDVTNKSIAVLVDKELAPDGVAGVCSDYIGLI